MSLTELFLKMILLGFIFWLSRRLKQLKKLRDEQQYALKRASRKGKENEDADEAEEEELAGRQQGPLQRPPSVIWYSVVEAARMLGQSGK